MDTDLTACTCFPQFGDLKKKKTKKPRSLLESEAADEEDDEVDVDFEDADGEFEDADVDSDDVDIEYDDDVDVEFDERIAARMGVYKGEGA